MVCCHKILYILDRNFSLKNANKLLRCIHKVVTREIYTFFKVRLDIFWVHDKSVNFILSSEYFFFDVELIIKQKICFWSLPEKAYSTTVLWGTQQRFWIVFETNIVKSQHFSQRFLNHLRMRDSTSLSWNLSLKNHHSKMVFFQVKTVLEAYLSKTVYTRKSSSNLFF